MVRARSAWPAAPDVVFAWTHPASAITKIIRSEGVILVSMPISRLTFGLSSLTIWRWAAAHIRPDKHPAIKRRRLQRLVSRHLVLFPYGALDHPNQLSLILTGGVQIRQLDSSDEGLPPAALVSFKRCLRLPTQQEYGGESC